MHKSPETSITMDEEEVSSSEGGPLSCLKDRYHRKLAICSIICGCSCIGIYALIHSVKAEAGGQGTAARSLRRARKLSIMSIIVWFCFLASIPVMMTLISYLLTLRD